ncbi:hypothetical protein GCM10020229_60810 [Kitasatospora albolonga]
MRYAIRVLLRVDRAAVPGSSARAYDPRHILGGAGASFGTGAPDGADQPLASSPFMVAISAL